jgi:hypothetical protein
MAHPAMLKAITAAKEKNDRVDAEMSPDTHPLPPLPSCS